MMGPFESYDLFAFVTRCGVPMAIELTDRGQTGFEVQVYERDRLVDTRRFLTRVLAQAWAEDLRRRLKRA